MLSPEAGPNAQDVARQWADVLLWRPHRFQARSLVGIDYDASNLEGHAWSAFDSSDH